MELLLGSPRVHGDEEEEGSDDIESEFASSIAGRSNIVHPYRVSVAESSINSWDIDSVSITNSGTSVHFYEEVMNFEIPIYLPLILVVLVIRSHVCFCSMLELQQIIMLLLFTLTPEKLCDIIPVRFPFR